MVILIYQPGIEVYLLFLLFDSSFGDVLKALITKPGLGTSCLCTENGILTEYKKVFFLCTLRRQFLKTIS